MALEELFANAINAHAREAIGYSHVIGTAINVTEHLCDVTIDNEATLLDVRLHAIDDNSLTSSLIVRPAENSLVVVGFINDDKKQAFIVQCSEIQELIVKLQTTEFRIKPEGYQIKKGEDDLKEVIQLLAESQNQIFVLYGNNPDYDKIAQALLKLNNILL